MRRMHFTLRLLFFGFLSFFSYYSFSQTNIDKGCKPPINRARWHDLIDKEQKNALKADKKADNFLNVSADEEINFLVTQALIKRIDALQCVIERDTIMSPQGKIRYLDGIEELLKNFTAAFRSGKINASNLPRMIEMYEAVMQKDKTSVSIENIISKNNYEVANAVLSTGAFNTNPAYKTSRQILLRKYTATHPERIFAMLKDNTDVPFRDSLILIAAYKYPTLLYDYAAANNKLGYAIRKIDDPLVKAVTKMATSDGSGQLYFPFLDNIIKGSQTIEEIDAVKNDDVKYYKLLVKTRLDYLIRSLQKERLYGMAALNKRMENRAKEYFVKTINALHEQPDAVRFRILQQLNAQELYYLAVLSESEIYTSSYTRGVYPAIMQKIGQRGDSLLMSVSFDRYKKFIKIAAGFNTLSNFLSTFPDDEKKQSLMTAFVNGLEKSTGLEDGVDVADSYASIAETIKPLAAQMLQNVKYNYDRNLSNNDQRGMVMYNLLYKLFLSADSSNNINLSKEFGIPPVYSVAYSSLANESQQVVMQVFFYGDEDGRNNYAGFMRQFSGANWKISSNPQWVTINSTRGKSIIIYANKPLDEEKDEDAKAQEALDDYLKQKNTEPTIVVHRGHSYYASYTIAQIKPAAKIVFLGSCASFPLIYLSTVN